MDENKITTIYVLLFVVIVFPAVVFPYFFHDSAQTFESLTCLPNAYFSAMGRPLHGALLCLMNKLIPRIEYFSLYRVVGAVMLGVIASKIHKLLVSCGGKKHPLSHFLLPILIVLLPGSLLQVFHYQALPFVLAIYLCVSSVQAYSASESPKFIGVFLSYFVSCFIYQASTQIIFVLLSVILFFSYPKDFSTWLLRSLKLMLVVVSAMVSYFFVHRFLFKHAYLFFDPIKFSMLSLGDHSVDISFANFANIKFFNFLLEGMFFSSLRLWFPGLVISSGVSLSIVTLLLIVASVMRSREWVSSVGGSFWKRFIFTFLLATSCLYGAIFSALLIYPHGGCVGYLRCNWFQSAVIVVMLVYVLMQIPFGKYQRIFSYVAVVVTMILIVYELVYFTYVRVLPNYREYQFIRQAVVSSASKKPYPRYLVIAPDERRQRANLGVPIADEFHHTSTCFNLSFIVRLVLRELTKNDNKDIEIRCFPRCEKPSLYTKLEADVFLLTHAEKIKSGEEVVVDFRELYT